MRALHFLIPARTLSDQLRAIPFNSLRSTDGSGGEVFRLRRDTEPKNPQRAAKEIH
jgi:hypothetical protein